MKIATLSFTLLIMLSPMAIAEDERDPARLNVSIALFDPGIPADRSLHRDLQVFPRVRKIEALYLPFLLHDALVDSRQWGAVRIVPEPDAAAELLLSGTILGSDGDALQLQLRAVDASGTVWVDRVFAGTPQNLYAEFSASLVSARATQTDKMLRDIIELSLLRYAQQLAPAAFDDYLDVSAEGLYGIRRLPASNDPMLVRIERIRGVEYIFTDAVDAKFEELSADIAAVYEVWGRYRRKFAQYQAEEAARISNSRYEAERGSFEAISSHYDNYKWDRQAAQEQEKWAIGFENEMGPTIAVIEARVAELEAWVADRYDEWRRILAELFEVETGL